MRRARGPAPADAPALPWLLPAAVLLAAFYAVPILDVARLAFTDATLIRPASGWSTRALRDLAADPALTGILRTTTLFTGLSVLAQGLAGLGLALLMVRGERRGLRGMAALRTLVLAAWVVPGIAGGLIWGLLFSEAPFGALNSMLGTVGLPPVAWLSDPGMALVSAVIANAWQGTAFAMIVLYAALKAIDPALLEAAAVDGASPAQALRHVTLPMLRGALLVVAVLATVQTLNTFDAILALTGGGPGRATEVLALHTFDTVFSDLDLAGGAALALMLFALSLTAALGLSAWLSRGEG